MFGRTSDEIECHPFSPLKMINNDSFSNVKINDLYIEWLKYDEKRYIDA